MNRSHTDINVPACDMDLPYVQYRDLFVYTNKLYGGTAESDRERMENVRSLPLLLALFRDTYEPSTGTVQEEHEASEHVQLLRERHLHQRQLD